MTTTRAPGIALSPGLTVPSPPFAHLVRLTDDTGLFEHARHAIARREHGYCTDDVARGLVVTSREHDPTPAVLELAERYLAFLTHAQDSDGAALGAAELLRADPGNDVAADLLSDAATVIGYPDPDPHWPWPQDRLTYANAALAEAVIAAGDLLDDPPRLDAGLGMLTWLLETQIRDGHLSVLPSVGWQRGGPRLRHDQQPIEVAALADACATAASITGGDLWDLGVRHSIAWFLGDNDVSAVMWDPETGGGYDGLTLHGTNLNQGAESTLALISTLQHQTIR